MYNKSSYLMRSLMLIRLQTMSDMTNNHSTLAHATYKGYDDQKHSYADVFHKSDNAFLKRTPSEDKTQQEKEENITKWQARFKMTIPYEFSDAKIYPVTIQEKGLPVTVSLQRCAEVPDDIYLN